MGIASIALMPFQARASSAHPSRQSIRYDSMKTWGSASATCSPATSSRQTVPSSLPYVCVSVQFSRWEGYHRGRITLTSPHGLNTLWTSFNGAVNRPILHAFSTQTVDLLGTWTAELRIDGQEVTRAHFDVVRTAPAPTGITTGSQSVSVSPAAPPPGYSVAYSAGTYELTDIMYGARLDLSRFTLTREAATGHYVLSFYGRATKVPSRSDGDAPTWQPGDSILRLVGSDLRPYAFYPTFCDMAPVFHNRELRNGQSREGWMCSEGIPTANTTGRYTLMWSGAGYTAVPVLNLTLTTSS
jgi:hypothetical protein